jgi:hypothetical protein
VAGCVVVYVSMTAEAVGDVANVVWVHILVRMEVHSLSLQFISAIGLYLDGLCESGLLGL